MNNLASVAFAALLVGYSPRVLVIEWADGTPAERIPATSIETCNAAIKALYTCIGDLPSCEPSRRKWPQAHPIKSAACETGDLFTPHEMCIEGYHGPRKEGICH